MRIRFRRERDINCFISIEHKKKEKKKKWISAYLTASIECFLNCFCQLGRKRSTALSLCFCLSYLRAMIPCRSGIPTKRN